MGSESRSLQGIIMVATFVQDSKITVHGAEEVAKVFQDILALEDKIEQDKEHVYVWSVPL
jgi:hypothetical protein